MDVDDGADQVTSLLPPLPQDVQSLTSVCLGGEGDLYFNLSFNPFVSCIRRRLQVDHHKMTIITMLKPQRWIPLTAC